MFTQVAWHNKHKLLQFKENSFVILYPISVSQREREAKKDERTHRGAVGKF